MSFSPRRTLLALALAGAVPLLAACPKKETPAVDAAPPEPAATTNTTTVLEPIEEEDAGAPEVDAAPPKVAGKPVNTNVARLKQCCSALGKEAARMGSSPEAGMFTAAAAQCSAMAAQAAPSGTAPELGALRSLLAGRTIPAVCSGF